MKQESKTIISLIGSVLFGIIANTTSTGVKTNGHYFGIIIVSVFVFFIFKWLLGKISDSDYVQEIQEQKELNKKVYEDMNNYEETKKSFKYFSNERLLSLYEQFQLDQIENIERLALEEELVERGLIENSPMHEKLYLIKKKFTK